MKVTGENKKAKLSAKYAAFKIANYLLCMLSSFGPVQNVPQKSGRMV